MAVANDTQSGEPSPLDELSIDDLQYLIDEDYPCADIAQQLIEKKRTA